MRANSDMAGKILLATLIASVCFIATARATDIMTLKNGHKIFVDSTRREDSWFLGPVLVRTVIVAKQGNDFLLDAELTNLSSRKIFDARVILHTADMSTTEGADVATSLEGEGAGRARFKILMPAVGELKAALLLDIKCYD